MNNGVFNNKNARVIPEFSLTELKNCEAKNFVEYETGLLHSLIYIVSGSGVLEIDFNEHIAIKNKLFFIEKYAYWRWNRIDNLEGVIIRFSDSFYNLIYTGNPKIRSDESLYGNTPNFIKVEENSVQGLKEIISIISMEYAQSKINSKEIICLSLKILMMIYRRAINLEATLFISDRKKRLLHDFRKLLNHNFHELKTPKQYALKLNISASYLNAICRDIYITSVSEVIKERVILEAKRLLIHTDLSVLEISYKLGFSDNSYFGRYFKKAMGTSPEKFRNLNKN